MAPGLFCACPCMQERGASGSLFLLYGALPLDHCATLAELSALAACFARWARRCVAEDAEPSAWCAALLASCVALGPVLTSVPMSELEAALACARAAVDALSPTARGADAAWA